MPIAGATSTPTSEESSIEAGLLLIGAGAILLFVSLFLEWYQPGIDAWEIFEMWDLVLALLAITAFVAAAGRLGFGPPRPATWLIGPATAALVIVLFNTINPPPLVPDVDGDPSTGLWLALAASILMAAGALLSVARISVAIGTAGDPGRGTAGTGDARGFGRGRTADRAGTPGGQIVPAEPAGPGVPGPAPGAHGAPPTEPTRPL